MTSFPGVPLKIVDKELSWDEGCEEENTRAFVRWEEAPEEQFALIRFLNNQFKDLLASHILNFHDVWQEVDGQTFKVTEFYLTEESPKIEPDEDLDDECAFCYDWLEDCELCGGGFTRKFIDRLDRLFSLEEPRLVAVFAHIHDRQHLLGLVEKAYLQ